MVFRKIIFFGRLYGILYTFKEDYMVFYINVSIYYSDDYSYMNNEDFNDFNDFE